VKRRKEGEIVWGRNEKGGGINRGCKISWEEDAEGRGRRRKSEEVKSISTRRKAELLN
jgi:hypothetical protein